MVRPVSTEHRVATFVRIPLSLRKRLEAEADRRHVSMNYLITKAVEAYLQVPLEKVS